MNRHKKLLTTLSSFLLAAMVTVSPVSADEGIQDVFAPEPEEVQVLLPEEKTSEAEETRVIALDEEPESGDIPDGETPVFEEISPVTDEWSDFPEEADDFSVEEAGKSGNEDRALAYGYSGSCGEKVYYEYKDTGVLTIYGTGAMYDYDGTDRYTTHGSETPWVKEQWPVKKVIIDKGVTHIGNRAFLDCKELTDIVFQQPDAACTVTSIGKNAFWGCSSITSIVFPDTVQTLGEGVLRECASLNSVTFPAGIQELDRYSCMGCTSLSSLELPDGLEKISESSFNGCTSLAYIGIPASVKEIGPYTFRKCSSLTTVQLPSGLTRLGYSAFEYSGLLSITIDSAIDKLEQRMFYGCEALRSVQLPGSIRSIGYEVITGCDSLESFTIPKGVTTIEKEAFHNVSLSEITIPDTVTTLEDRAFAYAKIKSVRLPNSITDAGREIFIHCTELTEAVLPSSLEIVPEGMFSCCTSLKKVTIPTGVKEIKRRAFDSCSSLSSIDLPDGLENILTLAFTNTRIVTLVFPKSMLSYEYCILGPDATGQTSSPQFDQIPNYYANPDQIYRVYFTGDARPYLQALSNERHDLIYYPAGNKTWEDALANEYQYYKDSFAAYTGTPGVTVISLNENAQIGPIGSRTYTGSPIKPEVTVLLGTSVLKENTDYSVSFKNNVNAGTATVTVNGVGKFNGSLTDTFQINKKDNTITAANVTKTYNKNAQSFSLGAKALGNASLTFTSDNSKIKVNKSSGKVTVAKGYLGTAKIRITAAATANYKKTVKTVTVSVVPVKPAISTVKNTKARTAVVTWKKAAAGTGYELQYGLKSSFSGAKTVTVNKLATGKATLSKLTKGKTYYVRLRTYKTVSGKKLYSGWSSVKKVKITK